MRVLIALLLTGCASMTNWDWHKAGASQTDYETEREACNAQVPVTAALLSPAFIGVPKSDECMMKNGWTKKPREI